MAFGIMGRLSTEDDSVLEGEEGTADTNIVIDITLSEAEGEAAALESEIAEDVTAMAQADVAADQVEETIETAEEIAANPETVTPAVVEVTVESLRHTAAILGGAIESRYAVSREAAQANPMVALEVSIDGAKDFLKKLYESIKAIFRKIINAGKKLFVKLVVVMDGTVAKAKKLQKVVEKQTGAPKGKFEEKEANGINHKFSGYLMSKGKTSLNDAPIEALTNNIQGISKLVGSLESTVANGADEIQLTAFSHMNVAVETLSNSTNYESPSDADKPAKVAIVHSKGSTLKVVESYVTDGGEDKKLPKLKVKAVSVSKDYTEGKGLNVLGAKEISAMLSKAIVNAPKISAISSEAMKAIDAGDKALDKLAKDESSSKAGYVLQKLKAGRMTAIRDVTTGLVLDHVLAHVAFAKDVLFLANAHYKKYGPSDM